MRRRVPLNPCDYLFLAHHNMMQQSGQTGNVAFMVMEVEGDIDPHRLEDAVTRALAAHPVAAARARVSWLTGWPHWILGEALDSPACVCDDLRGTPDWGIAADTLCQERFAAGWDVRKSPQVRIEHYRGPADRSRIVIRWPHALMDAEGAQWFMHEIDRLDRAPHSSPLPCLLPDGRAADALGSTGVLERIGLIRTGVREHRTQANVNIDGLGDSPPAGGRWRYMHRSWFGESFAELRRRADEWCPSGPARFSRYLGGCVLRALHRLFLERHIDTEAYLATLPMRVRSAPKGRPVHGNYLVSSTLVGRRAVIEDKRALLDELAAQTERYLAARRDQASWAMIWAMSFLREWQYRRLLGWSASRQRYASGFSYYGEIDPPLRTFVGARVLNFFGCASMGAPPGWNPAFSRFADGLNFAVGYLQGYHSDATVGHFIDMVQAEMFDRT